MGSDIPDLNSHRISSAMLAVLRHPNSIICNPTRDGGYCLIGRSSPKSMNEAIFENIAWSTANVMEQTRLKLRSLSLSWHELEALDDVDDLAAAERYLTL
jgi:uncharacterized protein